VKDPLCTSRQAGRGLPPARVACTAGSSSACNFGRLHSRGAPKPCSVEFSAHPMLWATVAHSDSWKLELNWQSATLRCGQQCCPDLSTVSFEWPSFVLQMAVPAANDWPMYKNVPSSMAALHLADQNECGVAGHVEPPNLNFQRRTAPVLHAPTATIATPSCSRLTVTVKAQPWCHRCPNTALNAFS